MIPQEHQNYETALAAPSHIPYDGYNAPLPSYQDSTIMHMRWDAEDLKAQLFKTLLDGRESIDDKGLPIIIPGPNPLLNQRGVSRVMSVVNTVSNPIVSLSYTSEEATDMIFNSYMRELLEILIKSADDYDIKSESDLQLIYQNVRLLVYHQLRRAVNGWEGKNSKTQTIESKGEQTVTNKTSGGFSLNPFSKRG